MTQAPPPTAFYATDTLRPQVIESSAVKAL